MKNPKMRELKAWLKKTAVDIRKLKLQHKDNQRNHKNDWREYLHLNELRWEYRHRHIAYSELRGRTRDQIESKLKDDTPRPNEKWIQGIKDEVIAHMIKEDVA